MHFLSQYFTNLSKNIGSVSDKIKLITTLTVKKNYLNSFHFFMFNPTPGMSHLDYNRLLDRYYRTPAVSVPMAKSSSVPHSSSDSPYYHPYQEFQTQLKEAQKETKNLKSSELRIEQYQKEILYGTLLGDASLATENGGRTYRLRLVQSENHKDYLDHLVFHFEKFGKTAPKINPANSTYYWNSLQSGSFRFYGQEFYKQLDKNKFEKKVPENVKRWLTPRVATYWFLDDGSAKDKKTTNAIRFCTDSFSFSDVERLAEGLETNFDIKTSIFENRPNQYRIYCKAPSVSSFWDQVVPILQNEIQPTAPKILTKLPNKIYTKVMDGNSLTRNDITRTSNPEI